MTRKDLNANTNYREEVLHRPAWLTVVQGGQTQTPLVDALQNYINQGRIRQHMPGHKGNPKASGLLSRWGDFAMWDVTEAEGLDDLHAPEGVIAQSEWLMADAVGADKAHFLVNGATVGLLAAIMCACRPGDGLLLPRNAHRAAWSGIAMSGCVPHWLQVDITDRGLPLGITPEQLENALEQDSNIKAALFVYPSFYGVCVDLPRMLEICRKHGVTSIVDEAHGAHFAFVQPELSAVRLGADIVIDSWHKSMGSLGQTAVMLVNNSSLHPERWLTMLQTTSPSYPMLASLDEARAEWQAKAEERSRRLEDDWAEFCTTTSELSHLRVYQCSDLPEGYTFDRTKLLIYSGTGHTGWQVAEALRKAGIEPEFADRKGVLFLLSYADVETAIICMEDFLRLADKLLDDVVPESKEVRELLPLPEVAMTPAEAMQRDAEFVPIHQAVGRVAAGLLTPYPPGIPWVGFGELINEEVIAAYELRIAAGAQVQGLTPDGLFPVIK
jgi:arginine decarboxylase